MMRDLNEHFALLRKNWPSTLVSRSEIKRFSGGIITPSYIANMDCRGLGPAERIRIGRKIAYPVDSLIAWLKAKSIKLEPMID